MVAPGGPDRRPGRPPDCRDHARGPEGTEVIEGGVAEKAGVRDGDEIVSIGGKTVASREDFTAALQTAEASTKLVVKCDGKDVELPLTLPVRPDTSGAVLDGRPRSPPRPRFAKAPASPDRVRGWSPPTRRLQNPCRPSSPPSRHPDEIGGRVPLARGIPGRPGRPGSARMSRVHSLRFDALEARKLLTAAHTAAARAAAARARPAIVAYRRGPQRHARRQ